MVVSINTNSPALTALLQLNSINRDLEEVQSRVASGYKVDQPKDNASIYATAQHQRADINGYDAVQNGVQRGSNILDVALAAMQGISDLIIEMKAKATQAADPSLTPVQRAMTDADYQAYRLQIDSMINAASFDGFNLIDKNPPVAAADDLKIISEPNANPGLSINIPAIDVKAMTSALLGNVNSVAAAQAEIAVLNTMMQSVNSQLAVLGGHSLRLETHAQFIVKLQDSLSLGVGSLVDADLVRESARLQAVQIQQQLATQALQIANNRPQQILALFRN